MCALARPEPRLFQEQFSLYVEEVCRHVQEASTLQEARVDAYLDGVTLAAEQVQDVRLQNLETPKQPSGWDFWSGLAITFLLESNIAGSVLRAITSRIFTPIVRSNALWLRLPKSPSGQELETFARKVEAGTIKVVAGGERITRKSVLEKGFGDVSGRLGKDSLQLYHRTLQELHKRTEPLDIAGAVAKAANQFVSTRPESGGLQALATSPGVIILGDARTYARATRLGIRTRAARLTSFARTRATLADLGLVAASMTCEDLEVQGATVALDQLQQRITVITEALIWARLHGFWLARTDPAGRTGPGTPELGANNDEPLKGVSVALVDYWLDRFTPAIQEWAATAGWATMPTDGRLARAMYLRGYFAALSANFAKCVQPERGALAPL